MGRVGLGASFSHRQVEHLGGDSLESLDKLIEMRLELVRLAVYWSEIEVEKGVYVWDRLEDLMAKCESAGQGVVMTVGVKAPRWPEFYWPDFYEPDLSKSVSRLALDEMVKRSMDKLAGYDCVKYWQVENEPLDPVWSNQAKLEWHEVSKTVDLVRQMSDLPVVCTAWGNDAIRNGSVERLSKLADVVGIDMYYKQFVTKILGKSVYRGPKSNGEDLVAYLKQNLGEARLWIAELQAEPWEADEAEYKKSRVSSMSPEILRENYARVMRLSPEMVLLWGFEYWDFLEREYGDRRYFEVVEELRV